MLRGQILWGRGGFAMLGCHYEGEEFYIKPSILAHRLHRFHGF